MAKRIFAGDRQTEAAAAARGKNASSGIDGGMPVIVHGWG